MSKAPAALGPSPAKNRARGEQDADTTAPAAFHCRISSACSTCRGALSQIVSRLKAGLLVARIARASAGVETAPAGGEEAASGGGNSPSSIVAAPSKASSSSVFPLIAAASAPRILGSPIQGGGRSVAGLVPWVGRRN